jgi:Tfp pilus assembly protein PilO
MNINNRQQLLAILAIAAVAIWAGDKLVVSPLTRSWTARVKQIAELRKSVSQGNGLLGREQSIRSRWDNMRTNTLPNEASVAENQVLKSFERWSHDSQISITSIKPQWKHNADDYITLECRVDAFGNLSTLSRFLYSVEKDPLALKVEAVEITARDNDGQQLSLALQVSGLLLSAPEP